MKVAVLGAKWSPCAEPMDQAVVPATGLPSPSVQVKAAPPHGWTSIPRCRLYQACRAGASLALKKMPPMPVTRFIEPRGRVVVRESVCLRPNADYTVTLYDHVALLATSSANIICTTDPRVQCQLLSAQCFAIPGTPDSVSKSDSRAPHNLPVCRKLRGSRPRKELAE